MIGRWIRLSDNGVTVTLARVVITAIGREILEQREYAVELFPPSRPLTDREVIAAGNGYGPPAPGDCLHCGRPAAQHTTGHLGVRHYCYEPELGALVRYQPYAVEG